ncbi:DUF4214 domain-containing protein [Candidatus Arthromitus sp. SFB-rat-Yit]|uniref:DUF4214 domain-containing protein n=1 Tax=Candidatus Arthromitus sp. SFB-rat-Yit TaxID=1041504 RepID=UPI000227A5E7|nr:DUF4214 domain-containing protein [Candidatus Arthromitus sp. SFB-rat-Yit]BAK81636.1 hypothetical protein RATSFB_1074 [Candidatus Arthromitus sp. SFB-rat-Yit]
MFSKKFMKKLIGIFLSLSVASGVMTHIGSKFAWAVPAQQSRYVEGDSQFTINLSNMELPAGTNPGAVDFNGNGKYDENEVLPLKGTEDFVKSSSSVNAEEQFLTITGVEGGVIRNTSVVAREDMQGYQKSYLRDKSTGGYAYIKVKFSGNVEAALKSNIDAAVNEYTKNLNILSSGKGSQIELVQQETLATIIQNSLGMKDESGNLVNKDFTLNVTYTSGAKTETKKISIEDLVMDTTTGKINQYTNVYNAPKIVDKEGNIYFKIYGLPTGSEITNISFGGSLIFPTLVDKSVVQKTSTQTAIEGKKGIIPYLDPLLTENINIDNTNPLDPLAIKPTVSYFVNVDVDDKGEIVSTDDNIIRYIGPFSEEDKAQGYNHANVRPLEDGVVLYDALYDPEDTIKRIQVKDSEGNLYDGKILKEDTKIGSMQSYAKLDNTLKDPQKNASEYKDLLITGLKSGTDYKFTELIVTFNSGDGDINRRFTNYDVISVNPMTIRTLGNGTSAGEEGDLLKSFELKNVTPTKAEFEILFNDPNGIIKDVSIVGDSIASSFYDTKENLVKLYGIIPNNLTEGLELVVVLKDGQELAMDIEPFTTKKITNAKEWIEGFYNIFFLRDGDPDGMAYWTSKLSSQEFSVNYFTSNIVNEQEYKEKNLDNTKYVERMYRSVTGRTSDSEGLAWWVKTLEETIAQVGDRTAAMQAISERMLGESETRNFLYSLGLRVE